MERKRGVYVKTAAALAVIVGCNIFLFRDVLQNTAFRVVTRPLVFLENALSNRKLGQLTRERDALLGKITDAEGLARENAALRRQLQVASRANFKTTLVHIIAVERTPLVSSLLIDKGDAEGIARGMVVVAPGNILVGRVEELYAHTSRVRIVDDPRSVISVRIFDTSLLAEFKGALRNNAEVNLISHVEKTDVGALLVTSGLDGYPESLAVANIRNIGHDGNSLFQSVQASLVFDAAQSPLLFILQ